MVNGERVEECDVVIVGGTTAALAAAMVAGKEGVGRTCLLEPTDWLGGQLSASGVTAIDWAWHTVSDHNKTVVVSKASRDPRNQPALLHDIVNRVANPGKCWVSYNCFPPQSFLAAASVHVSPLVASGQLVVLFQTVPVAAHVIKSTTTTTTTTTTIKEITAVKRTFIGDGAKQCGGYDELLSRDVADWYSPTNSRRFAKEMITVRGKVFIDASEWGELLVLSEAPYLQGIAERFDGDISGLGGSDTCGQAATYGFSEQILTEPRPEPPNPFPEPRWEGRYSMEGYTWERIWTYRRLVAAEGGATSTANAGDVTLQNWGGGNDNIASYLLLSREEARRTAKNKQWVGGVNVTALYDAETVALGWHWWFKNKTGLGDRLVMSKDVWGTCHGLVKIPYMRDTRRSIGVGGFVMNVTMIAGSAVQVVGEIFTDRVALGAYGCDIHGLKNGCQYPTYMHSGYSVLPYFVPLRALTNDGVSNLVVAGKTIAQSFLVNAATRLQPPEWSTGTAAGATAAFMVRMGIGSTAKLCSDTDLVHQLQKVIAQHAPLSWTIEEQLFPPSL